MNLFDKFFSIYFFTFCSLYDDMKYKKQMLNLIDCFTSILWSYDRCDDNSFSFFFLNMFNKSWYFFNINSFKFFSFVKSTSLLMFEIVSFCSKCRFCQLSNSSIFFILAVNTLSLCFFEMFVKNVATSIMHILTFLMSMTQVLNYARSWSRLTSTQLQSFEMYCFSTFFEVSAWLKVWLYSHYSIRQMFLWFNWDRSSTKSDNSDLV